MTMEKEFFYGCGKDIGGDNSKQSPSLAFHLLSPCQERLFLLGSAMFAGYESTLQSPNSFVSFY